MKTIAFEPLIPPALWVLLAVAYAVLLAFYGWRRPGSIARGRWRCILVLMALGITLVLVILLNPNWVERIAPPGGKPLLTVLLDTSSSMATPDAEKGATRFEAARRLARSYTDILGDRFEVRMRSFAGSSRPVDIKALTMARPEGSTTDLAGAIVAGLEEERAPGQALVVLSDGIHNAEGKTERVLDAVRVARGRAVPIFTRTLGGEAEVSDLAIELPTPQEVAFLDQQVPVPVRIRRRGLNLPRAAVALFADDKEVGHMQATFDASGLAEVRFEVRQPKRGLYRYEARVKPFAGELIVVNNREPFQLRVVDEPIQVLLIEGKPYWDAKFLIRALASDPSIELESVVRLAEGRLLRRTLARPRPGTSEAASRRVDEWKILTQPGEILASREALRRYQAVVLGRDADVFLTEPALASLRSWIARDGGSLVCYRGAPAARISQSLARLLPVRWSSAKESRFRLELTERGRDLRWFPPSAGSTAGEVLARLPTLARDERPQEPKPLAVVLATSTADASGEASPVVTYQPYGAGRVVVIEGAGMWRWAFLPPKYRQQDEVYGALWKSLMRWLASSAGLPPGQNVAIRADKISFSQAEPATATLLLRSEGDRRAVPTVNLTGGGLAAPKSSTPTPSGDEPGTYRVVFGTLPAGRYRAEVAGANPSAQAAFDVRGFIEEQLDLTARPGLLAKISRETGAAVLDTGSAAELARKFRAYHDRNRPERVRRFTAWDRWWILLTVIAVWGLAWSLRRSSGLV